MSVLAGKSLLVTGGGGAFGTAFAKRALADGARRIVIFSRGEARQAAMKGELADDRVRYLIGDVRDLPRLMSACRGVDVVIHAAALKRVETCEADPNEAIATNIRGTQNVAMACIGNGVPKAVLLSTDKAASPNTLYGVTKLAAERSWLASNVYAAGTPTAFAATRYGNVVGSTGSVVPLFRQQATSGVLTVTDPDCSRFWMSMDAAVDLVLLALSEMRGGDVFVPKVQAAGILSVAWAVAPEAEVRAIGLRPGEKIHETLITEDEARHTHDAGTHFVIEPSARPWGDVPALGHPRVSTGFTYTSATADQIPVLDLRALVAE